MEYLGNIFFDFDDTQYITTPSHRRYIDERWGIKTADSDYIGNPPLQNVINKHLPAHADKVSFNEVYLDVGLNFHTSAEWHKDAMPFKDMREVIMALAKEFTLWTVTLRQKNRHGIGKIYERDSYTQMHERSTLWLGIHRW